MATLFSHYNSMEIFSSTQEQLTPQSEVGSGQILNSSEFSCISLLSASETDRMNFELIQALMYIIVTCKYEMNPIKHVRENVMTPFFPTVTLSVAMETSGRIWPNFELIQALMHVLITCKYEKDPIKNSGENVMTLFYPL